VCHGLTENAFTTTTKKESDVYSYGVVLLELITRKKALDPSFMEETDIVRWVWCVWRNTGEIEKIVDSSLMEEILKADIREQVIDVVLVALRCTEKEPNKRPTMRDVVKQLLDANSPMRSKKSQPS
jgi:serine/threonine protein kinase